MHSDSIANAEVNAGIDTCRADRIGSANLHTGLIYSICQLQIKP